MDHTSHTCPLCGGDTGTTGHPTRRDCCAACGADLHTCQACQLHDDRAHNQCREPKAEWQAKRDRGNYCDFFELAEGATGEGNSAGKGKKNTHQDALNDLFKNF
jgi:hypothetical protein